MRDDGYKGTGQRVMGLGCKNRKVLRRLLPGRGGGEERCETKGSDIFASTRRGVCDQSNQKRRGSRRLSDGLKTKERKGVKKKKGDIPT